MFTLGPPQAAKRSHATTEHAYTVDLQSSGSAASNGTSGAPDDSAPTVLAVLNPALTSDFGHTSNTSTGTLDTSTVFCTVRLLNTGCCKTAVTSTILSMCWTCRYVEKHIELFFLVFIYKEQHVLLKECGQLLRGYRDLCCSTPVTCNSLATNALKINCCTASMLADQSRAGRDKKVSDEKNHPCLGTTMECR